MIKKKISIYFLLGSHLILVIILSYFYNFSLFIAFGISLFSFIFLKMVNDIGNKIPMKEVMSILFLIQVFISPLFTYRYFNNKAHFTMYVSEDIYMYFALPAILLFILGLFIPLRSKSIDYSKIFIQLNTISTKTVEQVSFIFIAIGFSISIFKDIIPSSLFFVFYLLKLLKFVGAFILFFSRNKLKYFWLTVVFLEFVYEIINGGVFYDLFVWGFFLYILLESKLKSSFSRKLLIIFGGFLTIYFIQSIKSTFRSEAWSDEKTNTNTEIFLNAIENKTKEDNVFENEDDFNRFISRLNNGWILSKVIEHTPKNEPFTNGETLKNDLINVLLPRFLFPNKAQTGGKQNQKKFTRFTGRRLIGSTTMRIGALSDAYINFGVVGGWIMMFLLGITFNVILFFINSWSLKNPFYLLWIPFIFAYAIRMSDFQVILNYTIKATIFVVLINTQFFKINSPKKS